MAMTSLVLKATCAAASLPSMVTVRLGMAFFLCLLLTLSQEREGTLHLQIRRRRFLA